MIISRDNLNAVISELECRRDKLDSTISVLKELLNEYPTIPKIETLRVVIPEVKSEIKSERNSFDYEKVSQLIMLYLEHSPDNIIPSYVIKDLIMKEYPGYSKPYYYNKVKFILNKLQEQKLIIYENYQIILVKGKENEAVVSV